MGGVEIPASIIHSIFNGSVNITTTVPSVNLLQYHHPYRGSQYYGVPYHVAWGALSYYSMASFILSYSIVQMP